MPSIKVMGIANVNAFLAAKGHEALVKASAGIKKAGFFVEGEVVQSIAGYRAEPKSVDTGNFKNSILAIFPTELSANIGCNKYPVPYADFLEYGTSRFIGRHHFENTAQRNANKVKDYVNAQIKTL